MRNLGSCWIMAKRLKVKLRRTSIIFNWKMDSTFNFGFSLVASNRFWLLPTDLLFFSNPFWCTIQSQIAQWRSRFWSPEPLHKVGKSTTFFSYCIYMLTNVCGAIYACTATIKRSSWPGVTQKIMLHVPATTYEPSEDPGLGITNPSVWIKEAVFSNITSSMLRGPLSIFSW